MFKLLFSVISLLVLPARLREFTLENLALRQQLAVITRQPPRPRLRGTDRWFWVCLARFWPNWQKSLLLCDRRPWSAGNGEDSACSGPGFPDAGDRVGRE